MRRRTSSWMAVAVVLAATTLAGVPAAAQFADDGLAVDGTSVYTVDLPARVVRVAVDLTIRNEIPPRYGPTSVRYSYFDEVGLPVLVEAANLVATTSEGAALGVRLESEEDGGSVAFAVIELASDLDYEETQQLRLTYDLPDQGPRAVGLTRVNPAYASVVPLPVGDPGRAHVRVVVSEGPDVEILGTAPLALEPGSDPPSYVASAIADPLGWDATLVLREPDAFESRTLPLPGDRAVEVRAWPGDTVWAEFVATHVAGGQPVMEQLVGRPWPVEGDLAIEETSSPYLYGYAGWYDTVLERIEIGDELDPVVVLHELSHAWFNRDLFAERWINEGFAEEVASRTLERLGQPLPQPGPIVPDDPGAIRLADWSTPALSLDISHDQERYGYNAAFTVVRALYDEVGTEAMARVIAAAAEHRIAYRGDPAAEVDGSPTGWRRLLDLVEELTGSQQALGLFATHVVPPSDEALLGDRAAARAALADLAAAGAGWSPPYAVRSAMAAWDFPAALAALQQAQAVLDQRDRIVAAVAPLGLGAPPALEDGYESAEDLATVATTAADLLDVTDDLAAARTAADADHPLWTELGLLVGHVDQAIADAEAAFDAADPDGVLAAVARVHRGLDRADDLGRAALAAAALLLVVGIVAIRRGALRRPGRGRPAAAGTGPTGGAAGAEEASGAGAPIPAGPASTDAGARVAAPGVGGTGVGVEAPPVGAGDGPSGALGGEDPFRWVGGGTGT